MKQIFTCILLALLCLIFNCNAVFAQDGTIDNNFNPSDPGFGQGDGFSGAVNDIVMQPDGKALVSGGFTAYNGSASNYLVRLNTDGTKDATFITGTGANSNVYTVALQADGKILIGGSFLTYNGIAANRITRLNADGTIDPSFTGTGASDLVRKIILQPDGKILVIGLFTSYNGTTANQIVRLNSNGTTDASFSSGTGSDGILSSIVVLASGQIIVGGNFGSFNNVNTNNICGLNSDGSLSTEFFPGNGFYAVSGGVACLAVQADGKILVGGSFVAYDGFTATRIVRLYENGVRDALLGDIGPNTTVSDIDIQADGKIIIAGAFTLFNGQPANYIARLYGNDGTLDLSFAATGANNSINAIALQADGKVLAGGVFSNYSNLPVGNFTRILTDGSKDPSYNIGTGANNAVSVITAQPDGKLLAGGTFTAYNNTNAFRLVRVNADGSRDLSFTGTGTDGTVSAITLQPDGKILVGGTFTTYNGAAANNFIRLNADGTRDLSLNGSGANGTVSAIAVQADGRILIAGAFGTYNGTSARNIARLQTDGTLDATFISNTGALAPVLSIAIQADGKIMVGGSFTTYNSAAVRGLLRLLTNGTRDVAFNTGISSGIVNSVVIQTDGKILIGGTFITYGGITTLRIARLNSDGTKDGSFMNTGTNGTVNRIALQQDNKILVGGSFTTMNGVLKTNIARINTSGTTDVSFTGTGANGAVSAIAVKPNGGIMIGGSFTAYNGTGRNRIAGINNTLVVVPLRLLSFTGTQNGKTNLLQWQTADEINTDHFSIEKSTDAISFSSIGLVNATGANNYSLSDVKLFADLNYYRLKIIDHNGQYRYSNMVKLGGKTKAGLNIYPNPVTDVINVQINDQQLMGTSAAVIDANGKVVMNFMIRNNTELINVKGLSAGIYKIRTAGGTIQLVKK